MKLIQYPATQVPPENGTAIIMLVEEVQNLKNQLNHYNVACNFAISLDSMFLRCSSVEFGIKYVDINKLFSLLDAWRNQHDLL